MMGWMAPLRHLGAKLLVVRDHERTGAIHGQDYDSRIRFGQACFSGARGRRGGSDGSAEAASASPGFGVLQSIAALSGRVGGVRNFALLGSGAACAWP